MKECFLFLILLSCIAKAWGGDQIEGVVTKVGIRGDGSLFVEFDKEINEPGCSASKFEAQNTHPYIDRLLSIALASKASGIKVNVRTNGCVRGAPGFDNSQSSYFYLGERT